MYLSEMLLDLCNPLRKAAFFGAIFNTVPTYAEINLRTNEKSSLPDVNELFLIRTSLKSTYGDPGGINASLLSTALTRSKLLRQHLAIEPRGFGLSARANQVKTPVFRLRLLLGEPTSINLEHHFDDLFKLKKKFEALGMVIKDGTIYLPDLAGSI